MNLWQKVTVSGKKNLTLWKTWPINPKKGGGVKILSYQKNNATLTKKRFETINFVYMYKKNIC